MTAHQRRLWLAMIDLIQRYIDGDTHDFCSVVGKLEGALDAAEIKDTSLLNTWYQFWLPLESRRAILGN